MSNEYIAAATPEQEDKLKNAVDALTAASTQAATIREVIAGLRNELNSARKLLGSLKEVIGPRAYPYDSRTSWHAEIDRCVNSINGILK